MHDHMGPDYKVLVVVYYTMYIGIDSTGYLRSSVYTDLNAFAEIFRTGQVTQRFERVFEYI